jgi:hypothetical protein
MIRPYISLAGDDIKGPIQYPIVYTETMNPGRVRLLAPNSSSIDGTAGSKATEQIDLP